MKINIPQPCSENWKQMELGINSRHCAVCSKNVIDFTKQSREDIYKTLLRQTTETVCGRFKPSQLDFSIPHEAIKIYPQQATPKKASRIPFLALSLAIALSSSCDAQTKPPKPSIVTDTVHTPLGVSKDSVPTSNSTTTTEEAFTTGMLEPVITEELMGKVIAIPEVQDTTEEVMISIAEVMPEFPGGDKALFHYISSNLEYPKWEYEQRIFGTLYVKFIIGKDGKAHSPKILKPIEGSKNFNALVIDLVNNMPLWNPATQQSKPISMAYYLPIKFVIPKK
jgi:hypothetical protein